MFVEVRGDKAWERSRVGDGVVWISRVFMGGKGRLGVMVKGGLTGVIK